MPLVSGRMDQNYFGFVNSIKETFSVLELFKVADYYWEVGLKDYGMQQMKVFITLDNVLEVYPTAVPYSSQVEILVFCIHSQ